MTTKRIFTWITQNVKRYAVPQKIEFLKKEKQKAFIKE